MVLAVIIRGGSWPSAGSGGKAAHSCSAISGQRGCTAVVGLGLAESSTRSIRLKGVSSEPRDGHQSGHRRTTSSRRRRPSPTGAATEGRRGSSTVSHNTGWLSRAATPTSSSPRCEELGLHRPRVVVFGPFGHRHVAHLAKRPGSPATSSAPWLFFFFFFLLLRGVLAPWLAFQMFEKHGMPWASMPGQRDIPLPFIELRRSIRSSPPSGLHTLVADGSR